MTMIHYLMSEADLPDFYQAGHQYTYMMAMVFPAVYVFYMLCVTQRYAKMPAKEKAANV